MLNTDAASNKQWDDEWFPEEVEPMTLCIAAECECDGVPAIAMCCDCREQTGDMNNPAELVGSDYRQKIINVGGATAMLAGAHPKATELLTACKLPILQFCNSTHSPLDFDVALNEFLKSLRKCAGEQKKEMVRHFVNMSVGMEYDEFRNLPTENFMGTWSDIRKLTLGADLLICSVSDEPIIIRLDRWGETHWEPDYGIIGSGREIARAFLCLQPWLPLDQHEKLGAEKTPLPITECLYRIYEAKMAAHIANPSSVGEATAFQILIKGKRFNVSEDFISFADRMFRLKHQIPNVKKFTALAFREGDTPPRRSTSSSGGEVS